MLLPALEKPTENWQREGSRVLPAPTCPEPEARPLHPPRPGSAAEPPRAPAGPGTSSAGARRPLAATGSAAAAPGVGPAFVGLSVFCPSFVQGRSEALVHRASNPPADPLHAAARSGGRKAVGSRFKTSVLCSHSQWLGLFLNSTAALPSSTIQRWHRLRVGCLSYSVLNPSQSTTHIPNAVGLVRGS